MSFCVAGVSLRDIPTCLIMRQKSLCVVDAILLWRFRTIRCSVRGRRSTLDVLCYVSFPNRFVRAVSSCAKCLRSTPHFTFYTLHSTFEVLELWCFVVTVVSDLFPSGHVSLNLVRQSLAVLSVKNFDRHTQFVTEQMQISESLDWKVMIAVRRCIATLVMTSRREKKGNTISCTLHALRSTSHSLQLRF